jgi:hypothetical protein
MFNVNILRGKSAPTLMKPVSCANVRKGKNDNLGIVDSNFTAASSI